MLKDYLKNLELAEVCSEGRFANSCPRMTVEALQDRDGMQANK
jgi:hypothetical protein